MPFVPFERIVIETPVTPDEVRQRLLKAVASRNGVAGGSDRPFRGTVGDGSFELRLVLGYFLPGYFNAFAPIAHGSFASGGVGTRVEVRMRLRAGVMVFMAFWLSFATLWTVFAIVYAVRDPSGWWAPPVGLAFFGVGYASMTLSFSHEARRMRASLERLLISAVPATELPRSNLSWLLDVRLRSAEPPERRFNSIFLGAYVLSGAMAVFNWERTVTACSNEQYRHGNEFSCPSDARIALAWVLAAILVATGFGSRFALHRRLRPVYILLLLVVIAVGAAGAWLVTHHPRWGVPR